MFVPTSRYSPNNGSTNETFQRRREWDDECLRFIKEFNKVSCLEKKMDDNSPQKKEEEFVEVWQTDDVMNSFELLNSPRTPLVWIGDLNW